MDLTVESAVRAWFMIRTALYSGKVQFATGKSCELRYFCWKCSSLEKSHLNSTIFIKNVVR